MAPGCRSPLLRSTGAWKGGAGADPSSTSQIARTPRDLQALPGLCRTWLTAGTHGNIYTSAPQ